MAPMLNRFYGGFDTERASGSGMGDDYRSPFQIDRDRVLHTPTFRRLQNKTQVFWSGEYDFYRTRLTHSLEVAQIGKSICHWLKTRPGGPLGDDFFIDPDLVEAVCLSHDLGHPPFGHAGERTLNHLMREHGGFEGNAQTLRLLTGRIFSTKRSGMDPSRAFLDGVLKYKSLWSEMRDADGQPPRHHFLYDDQHAQLDWAMGGNDFPAELTPGRERNSFKSIECQIMDWADDTAYSLNDVADGFEAGFITPQGVEEWAAALPALSDHEQACLEHLLQALRDRRVESRLGRKIGDFIAACELQVDANFLSPMTRRHALRLAIDPATQAEAKLYKKLAFDLVFRSPQLQQLDFKARHMLTRLFGVLHDTYIEPEGHTRFRLLPPAVEQRLAAAADARTRARLVCDALANMTDGFAIRTYKRLFDPDFGSILDLV